MPRLCFFWSSRSGLLFRVQRLLAGPLPKQSMEAGKRILGDLLLRARSKDDSNFQKVNKNKTKKHHNLWQTHILTIKKNITQPLIYSFIYRKTTKQPPIIPTPFVSATIGASPTTQRQPTRPSEQSKKHRSRGPTNRGCFFFQKKRHLKKT